MSLQAVGIILVVAMLVTPAASARLLTQRFGTMMRIAVSIGIGSVVAGLYLSYWLDVASGATIVLVETAVSFLVLVLGPTTGLLGTIRRRRAVAEPAG